MRQAIYREEPIPGFTLPDQPDAPYLDAFIDECGKACIWCRYCKEWHHHGPYNGHRIAHCSHPHFDMETGEWFESPYTATGYNLRIHGELTREIRLRHERRRAALSPRLRFLILKRDNYRCQICGRNAQDGIKLEIDHKLAWAKGGTDEESNLWTLCEECNRGKRDSDL